MSGDLKQQWGVGDPAQVGPDAQSQDLKAAFEKPMDAMAEHLQFTAANGERARHDPLAARSEALVPRYQSALGEVDPADPAKAKPSIDSLLANTESLGQEVAAFRSETEKAAAEWQSRAASYDAAVVQVEELQEWQHPKEGPLRGLVDGIRGNVNDRAYAKAIAVLDQFLPKLQPIYEDFQRQKAAQQEYEPASAALQPRLVQAAQPTFAKLAPQQSEIATGQSTMEASAQGRDFVAALATVSTLGGRVDTYTAAVEELTRLKQEYEQALAQVQPKLQAAPNPSPFNKLSAQQAELTSGQQQMESAAQAEEFEQALAQANELGTKADVYTAAVEELTRLKQEYEQALSQVQPKLQAAPNPSPFQKLASQQGELASGQQQMETAAQAEEFEQALQQANDLGTKADAYTAAVEELTRLKQEYEQALAQVQPKLQGAPNPSPFQKLASQQGELASGQQQMESAAQAEEFEQALQQANDLGTKADAYTAAVEELTRLKQEYEQALSQVQPKLQAAPNPSPFQKLAAQQSELASGQQQMETAAQAEEFEQALQQANEMGTKADAYTAAVEELTRLKQEYEQALAQVQPKLQAAPNPSPFQKLASQQAELTSGQQQMETAAQAEEFEQALQQANDLGTKAEAYTAAVEELTRLKQEYEQALAQVQPKLQAAPNPSPFQKLAAQQSELASGQQQMETAAQAEEFEQALQQANELGTKADAYTAAVEELTRLKQEYEQALSQVQPKLQAAPNPSPFNKLSAQQAELTSGQQQMESAAQAEAFEQALQQANDLGTKADAYTAAVEELTRLKQEYEQALAQVQPKLQGAPNPSPFQKLASQQGELASGQQQMETAAQAEEFEQALQQANDLGTKADAYTAAVEELTRLKQEYEQALAQVQPKLQAAPNPSPFQKLAAQQSELASGQQQMETAAQAEEFEQALQQANEMGTKADAYTAAVEELTRLKQEYEQALAQVQPKLQAAPNPSPFQKLASQQAELTSGQQQMETAAQAEEFEQALAQASELGSKVDAYEAAIAEIERQKAEYDTKYAELRPRFDATSGTRPKKLASQFEEMGGAWGQMEEASHAEDYGRALDLLNDVRAKVEAYEAAVAEIERQKAEYDTKYAELRPRFDATSGTRPKKLASQFEEMGGAWGQMEEASHAEDYARALDLLNDVRAKVEAYEAAVAEIERQKAEYDTKYAELRPRFDATSGTRPKKLASQFEEMGGAWGQMEEASHAEDYARALELLNDAAAKVDAYESSVAESERQKAAYEQALAVLEPRLAEAAKSQNAKVASQQEAIRSAQTQMEEAAKSEDYERAIQLQAELTSKVDEIAAALAEFDNEGASDKASGESKVSDQQAGPTDRKLETLDREGSEPSGPQGQGSDRNLLGIPSSAAVWNPPFELEAADNTADATVSLIDIQRKLAQWNDVGYANEMSVANGAINKQLQAFSIPSRPLTAADVSTLTNVGLVALQAYKSALANLAVIISAELDKYTGASAQQALDNANELLHQEFMKGDGSNKVADLKEAVGKAKDFAGKIKDYVDYAKKTKSVIKQAEKLETISEQLKSFTGKLSTAKEALGLASDIATLAGKVSQKPGDTANSINNLRAGLNIVDFIMSKTSVPVIGQWWSGYIRPCAELALNKLQKLDDMIDKSTRSNLADEWWQRASKGMSAPNITDSGLRGVLLTKVFPGGQAMLNFMWSLFRGNPPDSVPDVVQKHMLKFRKQFNAGQPESDQLQTDSAWSNAWNLFGDEKSPNLKSWLLKNKESVWAMQYGALPHP